MKRKICNVALLAIIAALMSCNGETDKKEESTLISKDSSKARKQRKQPVFDEDCTNLAGIDNLIVNTDEATSMRKNFIELYAKDQTTAKHLAQAVWVDANVIIAFRNFLQYNTDCDGVKFQFAATGTNDSTTLIMIPTKPYDKGHQNVWKNINLPNAEPIEFRNFGLGKDKTKDMADSFEKLYREKFDCDKGDVCLSQGVWFGRCVFEFLGYLIENYDYEIDGIHIYGAAYSDIVLGTKNGQIAKHQSTLIMVPTQKHEDNWNLIPDIIEQPDKGEESKAISLIARNNKFIMNKKAHVKFDAGLNHGQLCPQICEN